MRKKLVYFLLTAVLAGALYCGPAVFAEETGNTSEASSTAGKRGWQLKNGKWYYILENGKYAVGWKKISGKWYYMNPDGSMQTGWRKISGRWYYFKASGAMHIGWLKWNDGWYFLTEQTGMKTGWLLSGGKWYYLDKTSGKMQEDCIILSNGIYYYLDKDGCYHDLEDQTAAAVAMEMKGDLKKALEYASELTYYGKELFSDAMTSRQLAEYGIENQKGNCYVKAGTFRELAVCMGYDAHQITGYVKVSSGQAVHSWVEIVINGEVRVFDPAGAAQLGTDKAFGFRYGDPGTYIYSDYMRMN